VENISTCIFRDDPEEFFLAQQLILDIGGVAAAPPQAGAKTSFGELHCLIQRNPEEYLPLQPFLSIRRSTYFRIAAAAISRKTIENYFRRQRDVPHVLGKVEEKCSNKSAATYI